jgi:ribosomal protein S18 acetylase RimI-like enzyme
VTGLPPATNLPISAALDNPVWAALTGPHRSVAIRRGRAARYAADVSPFVALDNDPDDHAWRDLAALLGPGEVGVFMDLQTTPPVDWDAGPPNDGVQLVADTFDTSPEVPAEFAPLTEVDVPDMLDLVSRTKPGPFLPRTIELGRYLGIRRGGALVAMAGERLHLQGWTEISAVCTDPSVRGQGLATALVRAVGAGIRARGETPLMHAAASNTTAIALYLELGFRLRRNTSFRAVRAPA